MPAALGAPTHGSWCRSAQGAARGVQIHNCAFLHLEYLLRQSFLLVDNDLLVRVEKLLVKLRNNLHNVAGLKAQALAAGNKLVEVPGRVHDPLLLIRHEVIQLLAQRPKLHCILFREFGVLPVVVIVLDYL